MPTAQYRNGMPVRFGGRLFPRLSRFPQRSNLFVRSPFGSLAMALLLVGCTESPPSSAPSAQLASTMPLTVEQGWDDSTRQQVRFTSFGSRLLPYDWLLALEQADSDARFLAPQHMAAMGFLAESAHAHNPDGLPVGFTREEANGRPWIGLGCAACHTGEVHFRGQRVRLDGGSGLIDFTGFEAALVAALQATGQDAAKFARFAKALSVRPGTEAQLKTELIAQTTALQARHQLNFTAVPYGHGRLDAFGQIFNAVAVQFLAQPSNRRAPDAPVSFPVLWDAPHLDVVQWNGSAPNAGPGPLLQNITTALAVYGNADLIGHDGHAGYPSTVNIDNLGKIQNWLYQLKSPQWPDAVFGALDSTRQQRGSALYAQHCLGCHALVNRDDHARKVKATLTPASEVGTDPRMVNNFLAATATSGELQGRKLMVLAGETLGEQAPTIQLTVHVAVGAALRHPLETIRATVEDYHAVYKANAEQHPDYYKARPLDGIWSSAPYLHNGSVPTLHELLLPPAQRSRQFQVGDREFDPEQVGFVRVSNAPHSLFDTALPGNDNSGHLYGTALSVQERRDLLEYLKSL